LPYQEDSQLINSKTIYELSMFPLLLKYWTDVSLFQPS